MLWLKIYKSSLKNISAPHKTPSHLSVSTKHTRKQTCENTNIERLVTFTTHTANREKNTHTKKRRDVQIRNHRPKHPDIKETLTHTTHTHTKHKYPTPFPPNASSHHAISVSARSAVPPFSLHSSATMRKYNIHARIPFLADQFGLFGDFIHETIDSTYTATPNNTTGDIKLRAIKSAINNPPRTA